MGGDGGADLVEAGPVGVKVPEGKEDREWFLHAQNTLEWPLAMELDHILAFGHTFGRDEVLARIIAFGGTGPKEQPTVEGNDSRRGRRWCTFVLFTELAIWQECEKHAR